LYDLVLEENRFEKRVWVDREGVERLNVEGVEFEGQSEIIERNGLRLVIKWS